MKVKELAKKLWKRMDQNSPTILSASALVGLALTAYSAYHFGIRAEEILQERKRKLSLCEKDEMAKKEVNKWTVKDLAIASIPTALSIGGTSACIIAAQKEASKRLMMVTAAYNLSENAVKDLNAKMKDVLGEKKTRQIKDEIKKDKLKKDGTGPSNSNVVLGTGDTLAKDLYSGRLFPSSMIKIERAITKASNDALLYDFVSLNDFYEYLGLEPIQSGRELGYNSTDLVQNRLPIEVTAILVDDTQPCLCIDYDYIPPRRRILYGDM